MINRIFLLILISVIITSCGDSQKKTKLIHFTGTQLDSVLRLHPDSVDLLVRHGNEAITDLRYDVAMAQRPTAWIALVWIRECCMPKHY